MPLRGAFFVGKNNKKTNVLYYDLCQLIFAKASSIPIGAAPLQHRGCGQ
jgi:hypothetical protein